MKILQVVSYFPPAYAFGGPVKVASQVSRELLKRGHDVVVYTTDAKDPNSRLNVEPVRIVDGIKVHYMRNLSMMLVKKSKLFITPELITTLKEEVKKFHVIHLHEYRTFQNIVVAHYAKKYGVPYVLQAHGSLPRIMVKRKLEWFYDVLFGYRLLRDAAKVIAISQVEAEQYKRMGVPEEKIAIIPNGIDLSEYAKLPPKGAFKKRFNIPEDKKIILYLGRIHRTKGISFLVKAYAYLTKNMKHDDTTLVIAGPDDGCLAEVKSLANSLGISDSVLFTGFISNKDKVEALVDADVFVTPSFYVFAMTFLEACATGTPIITTTLGDTLEWIDGNVGYVTPPKHRDLANAIHRILSDDELHRQFSRNCLDTMRNKFSLQKVIDKIEHLYREVALDKLREGV